GTFALRALCLLCVLSTHQSGDAATTKGPFQTAHRPFTLELQSAPKIFRARRLGDLLHQERGMFVNIRHEIWRRYRRAILFPAIALCAVTAPTAIRAQSPSFLPMPGCVAPPPPPGSDGFPVANTDALQTMAAPLVFTGATLLANDTGALPITIASIAAASAAGGTITGAGPYTYTPPTGFLGVDSFNYRIQNPVGNAVGLARVTVTADTIAPTVSMTAPAGGSVSGNVLVSASASDNVGVVGVSFLDGTTPIGAEDASSPYSVTWSTASLANGPHSLTAVARDAA